MEIKPLECLKMTFVADEIELEREKQFLNDMVSVFRERERVSGWEVGRRRPVHNIIWPSLQFALRPQQISLSI